ncbi:hypothetical protein BCR44DRAFT_34490 [Catenaria anguillulae PL171]|uniref:Uncharacterized protein n=1 Tax=Catenaria anguillulae PL171 TaxID=765915 RepID=A0A1Y2I4M4_9FUNG|nr:hypothetical protein BCR44DRAFT_34490 [Catenaria anguillulae PL171]
MTVSANQTSKLLQTPVTAKCLAHLAKIAPAVGTLTADTVQAVATIKTGSSDQDASVVLALYNTEYLPANMHITAPTLLDHQAAAAAKAELASALLVQITFIGAALVTDRVAVGVAAPQRTAVPGGKPSFEVTAQAAHQVYRWLAGQAAQVEDGAGVKLPWEPIESETLSPEQIRELERLASKARKNESDLNAADVLMCCTVM